MSNELEKTAQVADMKLDVDVRLIEPRAGTARRPTMTPCGPLQRSFGRR